MGEAERPRYLHVRDHALMQKQDLARQFMRASVGGEMQGLDPVPAERGQAARALEVRHFGSAQLGEKRNSLCQSGRRAQHAGKMR